METTRSNLTDNERRQIIDELLERSINAVLPRGALSEVAKSWKRGRSTIWDLWTSYQVARNNGDVCDAAKSKIQKKSGRKRFNRDGVCAKLKAVPMEDRQDIRRAANTAGVSQYMVARLLREGVLKRRTGRIKPVLTDNNKLRRVEYALSFIDDASGVEDDFEKTKLMKQFAELPGRPVFWNILKKSMSIDAKTQTITTQWINGQVIGWTTSNSTTKWIVQFSDGDKRPFELEELVDEIRAAVELGLNVSGRTIRF